MPAELHHVKVDPIFARKPDMLPFQAYSAAETLITDSVGLAGMSYASTAKAIHTPAPRSAERSRERQPIRPLPRPVAETVDVQQVADALDPELDADILRTITAVLSMDCLRERVLLPGFVGDRSRVLRAPAARVNELREKGYIRKLRPHQVPSHAFACTMFWVPKDDDTDRTIFRGPPLNRCCRRPDPTRFSPLPLMLERLTDPCVEWYLAYDFRTWFVELRLPDEVAKLFVVVMRNGSVWRVVGVPMGWSWAPTLAQAITLGLLRITMRRLPEEVKPLVHVNYGYLDNVIFALKDKAVAPIVDACWRKVTAEFGVVLKDSATETGTSVDWLGAVLEAGRREARFRARFLEKLQDVRKCYHEGQVTTVRAWWRMVALAVHVRWVRQETFTDLITPLRWLSRTAKELYAEKLTWSSPAKVWDGVPDAVLRAFTDACGTFVVRSVKPMVVATGQSDAASSGYAAFVVMFPASGSVVAVRAGPVTGEHINGQEFRAAWAGIMYTLRKVRDGVVAWRSDNTTACAWLQRRWSSEWTMNEALADLHTAQVKEDARVEVDHVPGTECIPDVMTRCAVNPQSECRASQRYMYSFRPACECRALCGHVAEAVRVYAKERCSSAGCGTH